MSFFLQHIPFLKNLTILECGLYFGLAKSGYRKLRFVIGREEQKERKLASNSGSFICIINAGVTCVGWPGNLDPWAGSGLGPGLIIVRITINLSTYAPRYVMVTASLNIIFCFPGNTTNQPGFSASESICFSMLFLL